MKKVVIVLVIILGIIVLILARKNKVSSQPALAARPDKFYCVVNGNGTITYGTEHWRGWFLFGHWETNPGAITAPGGNAECAGFLQGV